MLLRRNGYRIAASLEEKKSVTLRLAAGELGREGLLAWVRSRVTRK